MKRKEGMTFMKKILVKMSVFVGIFLMCISFNTLAAQKTEMPVKIIEDGYWNSTMTVNSFYVYDVENLYGQYMNRLYYGFDYEGSSIDLKLNCYNASGYFITSLPFYKDDDYIDVPDTTASVELVAKNPSSKSDSYLYYGYPVTVYAYDGRTMSITSLQLPVYKMVGWSEGTYLYSLDGREIEVSPFQVSAYCQVGWYTWVDYQYIYFSERYYEYLSKNDNLAIISLCNSYESTFEGTYYLDNIYVFKTAAMDRERVAKNAPVVVESSYISGSGSSIGANIYFYNVSYKPVIAMRISFDCYNVYGEKQYTVYSRYNADDIWISSGESKGFKWSIGGASNTKYISNIKITEVVFSDYTKWTNY